MHQVPLPHAQARLLQTEMKSRGHVVVYQDALEIVAHMMGYKTWKTMAAAGEAKIAPVPLEAPRGPREQASIPGNAAAPLYDVMLTTDCTMSAVIKVHATSRDQAIDLAQEVAAANIHLFEVDEGNYRGKPDFYVGDEFSVTPFDPSTDDVESPFQELFEALDCTSFAIADAVVENNMGMSGDYRVLSKDGALLLTASLNPHEPDNSDDDARAVCTLDVKLVFAPGHPKAGTVIASHENEEYLYHGDDRGRGDHLEDLMTDDNLFELLSVTPATAPKA